MKPLLVLTLFTLFIVSNFGVNADQVLDLENQEEVFSPRNKLHRETERRLSVDGRQMAHMHVHSSPLYGNSTDLMYFYVYVFIGSHRQPQTLIVDTGSSVACVPCKEYCPGPSACGNHINDLYMTSNSTAFHLYNCTQTDCSCSDHDRCRFYQGYAEGSRYDGYVVKDQWYFGENYQFGREAFDYNFGCAKLETNYFHSQDADGILGLSQERPRTNQNKFEPIYDVMFDAGLIEVRQFSLCLGKDGGYMQIGGYDGTGHIEQEITWAPMLSRVGDFKVGVAGMMMNNHYMGGSEKYTVGFLDSGTTFTYLSQNLYNIVKCHFQWFCSLEPENHCMGRMNFTRNGYLCFSYDQYEFPDGPMRYFESFPILRFLIKTNVDGSPYYYDWYPSEYLYRDTVDQYCIALDVSSSSNEIMMGGTFLRQHNVVFDVDNGQVGFARASCSYDVNQVYNETQMIQAGQRYALDPTHEESQDQVCDHPSFQIRQPRQKHPPPPPKPLNIPEPPVEEPNTDDENEDSSGTNGDSNSESDDVPDSNQETGATQNAPSNGTSPDKPDTTDSTSGSSATTNLSQGQVVNQESPQNGGTVTGDEVVIKNQEKPMNGGPQKTVQSTISSSKKLFKSPVLYAVVIVVAGVCCGYMVVRCCESQPRLDTSMPQHSTEMHRSNRTSQNSSSRVQELQLHAQSPFDGVVDDLDDEDEEEEVEYYDEEDDEEDSRGRGKKQQVELEGIDDLDGEQTVTKEDLVGNTQHDMSNRETENTQREN